MDKMQAWWIPGAALLLTACAATSQPAQPSNQPTPEEQVALRATLECGAQNLPSVDDGRSDAQTIALGLSLRCEKEYGDLVKVASKRYDNPYQREMYRDYRGKQAQRIEFFLPMVLRYRSPEPPPQ